jgi:hypothetical protein
VQYIEYASLNYYKNCVKPSRTDANLESRKRPAEICTSSHRSGTAPSQDRYGQNTVVCKLLIIRRLFPRFEGPAHIGLGSARFRSGAYFLPGGVNAALRGSKKCLTECLLSMFIGGRWLNKLDPKSRFWKRFRLLNPVLVVCNSWRVRRLAQLCTERHQYYGLKFTAIKPFAPSGPDRVR